MTHGKTHIFSLEDYIIQGVMTQKQKDLIVKAIQSKQNILIVGDSTVGKTTLASSILNELSENEKVITLEYTPELQCINPNHIKLCLNTLFSESQTMQNLLKLSLQLRPDRIILDELQDNTALDLLKAWNTGHPRGIATVNANSALEGLYRLEQLITEVITTPQRQLIAQTVQLIIFIKRHKFGRKIEQIAQVAGFENENYILIFIE